MPCNMKEIILLVPFSFWSSRSMLGNEHLAPLRRVLGYVWASWRDKICPPRSRRLPIHLASPPEYANFLCYFCSDRHFLTKDWVGDDVTLMLDQKLSAALHAGVTSKLSYA